MHAQCTNCRQEKTILARGMCAACYQREWRAGNLNLRRYVKGTPSVRFWSYVDASGDCWEWTGCRDRWGYGHFTVDSGWDIGELAHRFAYELFFGPPPATLHVCHSCDNPGCVRPDHLFLGSGTENERDKITKGRKHSQLGTANSQAKLTPTDVRAIRSEIETPVHDLAARFSVTITTIGDVRKGKSWKHLES